MYDQALVPSSDRLPLDPSTDVPDGFTEDQRGKPHGFAGDPDVMDTWATSSLTPHIAGHWEDDASGGLFDRVFPMDVRPQAHEIIRTWLFSTVVRSHLEHGSLPWRNAALSGWILDPDRKKMSKSKGNVVTPMNLLEQYGTDAVRYWAASGRPGVDTAFDEGQMKVGRKLATKILNATKFVLGFPAPSGGVSVGGVTNGLDAAMLARLGSVVADATAAFEEFDYARALERTEAFFWWFCDDHVELVKTRAYDGDVSAVGALRLALSAIHRLLAPFLPFTMEEVWSWWQDGSVHAARWPTVADVGGTGAAADDPGILDAVSDVLARVRRVKTEAKVSQRAAIARCTVRAPASFLAALAPGTADLCAAGSIAALDTVEADELRVDVELAPQGA
jgi:valyl-tRNA synthetase